ncbi:MAG TPA: S1-like domain-containing RNA-binding protein [Polyangiaceae bacterium]|nr:S1-like domain-containing RNA-binding protein [Polyangiaceae bacterium]
MTAEDLLGRFASLTIRRFGPPGAFLAVDAEDPRRDAPTLLLLGSEIPEGAETGQVLDVFVYLDSEGRPLATTRTPKLELGEVAFLEVTALTSFGAFVDWGLAKELLVPFAEQTTEMQVGARHPIGLYVDGAKRLAGTMRVAEMLRSQAEFEQGEWVAGEAWRNDPDIGLFVIIERSFIGLVPKDEPHALSRGEAAQFRVANVLPDGKIELSLRGHAHEELEKDGQKILDGLARPGAPRVGDRSSPEEIRALFGLSKKAFKRAVGRLLKQGTLSMDANGFLIPKTARGRRAPTPPSPRGGGS